jgi:hypothetical protein
MYKTGICGNNFCCTTRINETVLKFSQPLSVILHVRACITGMGRPPPHMNLHMHARHTHTETKKKENAFSLIILNQFVNFPVT